MTYEERSRRIDAALKEESSDPERLYYLSFAGDSFLGGVITMANGFITAIVKCKRIGISPGGSVRGYPLMKDTIMDPKWLDRLLTKEQVDEAFAEDEKSYGKGRSTYRRKRR